jgi:very-short-patch-repair endonuclease
VTRRLLERIKANARNLRHASTDAEARLWYNLRRHGLEGFKFRRQHPLGPYILDFYCAEARVVMEVDGSHHMEADVTLQNAARTRYLERHGLRVLRFNNREALLETDAVLNVIIESKRNPSN